MTYYRTDMYFESHITIDPVFEDELELFKKVAARHSFRVAKLLMRKREGSEDEPHVDDSFCTSRSESWDIIYRNTIDMVMDLRSNGFVVKRYKIEDTVIDSNIKDEYNIL